MAIRIGPLAADDPLLTNEAVDPPPTLANIATRFVLVPPELWPGVSPGGWVAKVISADQRTEVCKAKFSDGTFYFKFATVACWKTLS